MKPLCSNEIRGNWGTLLLSWNEDDTLDGGWVAAQAEGLVEMGVDGIYAFGSAGEFHAVTDSEFLHVAEILAETCEGSNVPFQIGVSHMSATIALERLRKIRALAPGAIQVTLPDWFPPSDGEIDDFLERMIDAAGGIGLVLYNPPHAKRVLAWHEIGRIAEKFPGVAGVKVADGDDAWYGEMRRHAGGLSVFVPGHHLATGIRNGAHGAYSNVACLNPRAAQAWTNLMATDLTAALEVERRICTFMDCHIVPFIVEGHYCNAAVDRLLALIGGSVPVGERMRWPYRHIPVGEADRLRPVARELLPEFLGRS